MTGAMSPRSESTPIAMFTYCLKRTSPVAGQMLAFRIGYFLSERQTAFQYKWQVVLV